MPTKKDDIALAVAFGAALAAMGEALSVYDRMQREFIKLATDTVGHLDEELAAQRKTAEVATAQAKVDREALDNERAHVEAMRIVLHEASTHIAEFSTANDEEIQARITRVTE